MRRAFMLLAALGLAGGCAPVVQDITVATPGAITAVPDAVTVVVIQPTTELRAVSILDGRGELVGQLGERDHTVIRLPEGPTILYAVLENKPETADRIEGTLVGGRVYYATVRPREGGLALVTLSPRSPDWNHKDQYVAATTRVQMDPSRIRRAANELGDPARILLAGDAHLATLNAAGVGERSFQESDGF